MSLDTDYGSESDAAYAVLCDVTRTFRDAGVVFAVVGGWVPLLFHSSERLKHPGTYDADLLIDEESLENDTFRNAVDSLLRNDYLRPAKNAFQAFRVVTVGGERRVFHADFLNPMSPSHEEKAFVRFSPKMQLGSAYTPAMDAVFRYPDWRYAESRDELEGVRFASELGFVVTKAHAATSKKRLRDLFDIFLTLEASRDRVGLVAQWQNEVRHGTCVAEAQAELRKAIASNAHAVEYAAALIGGSDSATIAASRVHATLGDLL